MGSVNTAAFFDLDKTIVATSASTAFSKDFHDQGLLTRADAIRTAYAQLLFMMGGADEKQTSRLRDSISELIEGWPVDRVKAIVNEGIEREINPYVYQEAVRLIRQHQANGRDVVIISASGDEVVQPIAAMLGADHAIGSRMTVADGKYTGTIEFYAYGPAKAEAVRELAEKYDYDLDGSYAYSDSLTDAPMLNAVGHGFAVNPDRAMRRACIENGWGVLRFSKPIALRDAHRRRGMAIGLVGLAIASGVAWWVMAQRRRQERAA